MSTRSSSFAWTDHDWIQSRAAKQTPRSPISIYEVHAESWLRVAEEGQRGLDWEELADRLIPYVKSMGFTHVEFMPIAEHPFGGSWGYQPLGQFAPSARFGKPEQFAQFVDKAHEAGLGVILDWVPAHFPNDAHGLIDFDGTPLYEHADPREGYHQDWNTMIYNLGRNEVSAFLVASGLAWLKRYHVDGLRVDAVASMLYRDYSRAAGEWVPNIYGGRENLESIAFLKRLNHEVGYVPGVPGAITIAEESTAWPGVTARVEDGGLGFEFKWNMGWMHDTLHYMEEDPVYRQYHHHMMTFGMVYAYSERFVLPLSHDEVVHGKGSLLGKMPGDRWQKFANLRAYFGFMWTHPGKKLLFMGGEFGQMAEFNHDALAALASARRSAPPRRAEAGARPEPSVLRRAGAASARLRTGRLRMADRRRQRQQRVRLPPHRRRGPRTGGGLQHDAGAARRLSDRHAARRTLERSAQHGRRRVWRLEHGQRRPDPYRGRSRATAGRIPPR